MTNLAQRVVTSVVAIPLVVGLAWVGGWPFGVMVTALAALAQAEAYGLFRAAGTRPMVVLGLALGAVASLRALVPGAFPLLIVGVLVVVAAPLARRSETPLLDAAATAFGVAYPALLLGSITVLRQAEGFRLGPDDAFWLTLLALLGIWGADTFAYTAGRLFGKHPLFPRVSPKKTWEGALGGLLGALGVAAAFKWTVLPVLSWADVGAVAFCCGVASPVGDLAESLYKRSVDVKDSATWLPGHGGMLDRLDAAAFAFPLLVLYFDHVARLF